MNGNNMTPNRNIPNQYGSPLMQPQPMAAPAAYGGVNHDDI